MQPTSMLKSKYEAAFAYLESPEGVARKATIATTAAEPIVDAEADSKP